jgi:hypothetical protein
MKILTVLANRVIAYRSMANDLGLDGTVGQWAYMSCIIDMNDLT